MAMSVEALTAERNALEKALVHLEPKPLAVRPRHDDAITPNVPEGFDTVLGYLAKHHPDVLDDIDYKDPKVTARDGWWLLHQARRRGSSGVWAERYVEAPPCLKAAGIDQVRAWPLSILAERWG